MMHRSGGLQPHSITAGKSFHGPDVKRQYDINTTCFMSTVCPYDGALIRPLQAPSSRPSPAPGAAFTMWACSARCRASSQFLNCVHKLGGWFAKLYSLSSRGIFLPHNELFIACII